MVDQMDWDKSQGLNIYVLELFPTLFEINAFSSALSMNISMCLLINGLVLIYALMH